MDIKKIDELMDMPIHESKELCTGLRVIRVFGGWIYETWYEQTLSCTFVPEPQQLISREQNCKVNGHRFIPITKKDQAVRHLNGIKDDDNNTYFICDKCGELTKSV